MGAAVVFECSLCPGEFLNEHALQQHHADCPGLARLSKKRADPGRDLEILVLNSARVSALQGLRLDQVGAPHRILRMFLNAIARVQLLGKGPLDFIGHLRGRYVTFDAKSTGKTYVELSEKGIKPHQMRLCQRHHDAGAIAFFLVEFRSVGEYYAVTWPMLFIHADVSSVTLTYCRRFAVPVERAGNVLALVGVVRQLAQDGG